MTHYDFDTPIDRRGTGSVKWDLLEKLFGRRDAVAMWVADMDFPAPRPVIDALVDRARHGVFGYAACMPGYYEASVQWMKDRHGWPVEREWILFSPGIVPAVNMLIQALTEPGDSIILQQPVYYPFMHAVHNNDRILLNSPLVLSGGAYRMDLDDLERKAAAPKAKLLILCSPHNPVGRVWTAEELRALGEICLKKNVIVIADEIHADLTLNNSRHTPFASLSEEFLMNAVTCTSPSKTFNLAGLHTANVIIPEKTKRDRFAACRARFGISGPNVFGAAALEAAYRHGDDWLGQVRAYIEANLSFLKSFFTAQLPEVQVIEPQATYLVWLDFRNLGLEDAALKRLLIEKAGVALDDGPMFGEREGSGFQRINIACPRKVLEDALVRIRDALGSR